MERWPAACSEEKGSLERVRQQVSRGVRGFERLVTERRGIPEGASCYGGGFSERLWRRNLLAERANCRWRVFMAF